MLHELGLKQPPNRIARSVDEAKALAEAIGYPLVVRPSYVLGGRAMEIVYDEGDLTRYMWEAVEVSEDTPVLLDRFLDDAVEVDVDAVSDGEDVLIGGIMEHIEQAGVHSGDSACCLPPYTLSKSVQAELSEQVRKMAAKLGVKGLMNTQFAIKGEEVFVIEVNPRASRTVPFVSKAIGLPLAKIAARCMVGQSLASQGVSTQVEPPYASVKEAVFPFAKFRGVDPILGPEMRSTGEVMGVGETFGEAFSKSQLAASVRLPAGGKAVLSVRHADRPKLPDLGRALVDAGFEIVATRGTARTLREAGIACDEVAKVAEGRPHVVDLIKNGEIALVVNTTEGRKSIADSAEIRRSALQQRVAYCTTVAGALATVAALPHREPASVASLQDLHERL
jgi:carbamoyl-phosphate synthase large subunit